MSPRSRSQSQSDIWSGVPVGMSRKRKRERDWSGVPLDILSIIASRVRYRDDYIALSCVCRSWRSAAATVISKAQLLPLVHWSMPVSYLTNTEFRSFSKSTTCTLLSHIHLPEMKGCNLYGSPFGWLISLCVRMNINKATISLFNPISRSTIDLPDPIKPFCYINHYQQFCVFKALLTAPPGHPHCFLVINYGNGKLACTRPGIYSTWHRINNNLPFIDSVDFLYFHGKLYAVGSTGYLGVLNLAARYTLREYIHLNTFARPPIFKHFAHPPSFRFDPERLHLVEFGGELLMVIKYPGYSIEIFKIDVHTKAWTRVESLGDSCLLLQDDTSFISVLADDINKLVPGCIYYPNTGTGDTKLVPGCVYYPDTSRYDTLIVPHHKLLIPRCIYYPTAQMWTVKQVNLLPDDVYSTLLYPSITFRPSMSSYV